ncbi:hypothetical protein BDDG_06552 [Blastomyces dermatitidis ATCC 18188]|nr:hypothetical protein BDDG_06552 [Blastomyces dermatitidis ATCC 18188]
MPGTGLPSFPQITIVSFGVENAHGTPRFDRLCEKFTNARPGEDRPIHKSLEVAGQHCSSKVWSIRPGCYEWWCTTEICREAQILIFKYDVTSCRGFNAISEWYNILLHEIYWWERWPRDFHLLPTLAATATSTGYLSQTASGTTTTPSITTNLTGSPKPMDIGCTPETTDKCVLALQCGFPRRTGCLDGKCVCILPPPPPPSPPHPINKGPTTLVTTTKKVTPVATEKPKVPLKVSQRQSHDKDVYQGRGDITGKWVEHQAVRLCDKSREIRPGESITDRKKSGIPYFTEVPYFMSIHWKKGCEMAVNIVNPAEPVQGTKCVNLLYENWECCKCLCCFDMSSFTPRHPGQRILRGPK